MTAGLSRRSLCSILNKSAKTHTMIGGAGRRPAPPIIVCVFALLFKIEHRDLRDSPAVIRAGYLELDHRDGVRWAAHNAQAAADTLLLVDDHVSATPPLCGALMHWIALHDTRETLHTDAIIRADVHAA